MGSLGPPPPHAESAFMGDSEGRSGWIVKMPDGSTEKYFVKVPESVAKIDVIFRDAPKSLEHVSVVVIVERYLSYLEGLISEARQRFA